MKSAFRRSHFLRRVFVLTVSLVTSTTAQGAIRFWRNNAGTGNWSDATKWSSLSAADTNAANNGVPVGGDEVRIDNTDGTAHAVTFNAASISLSALTVDLTGPGGATNTLSNSTANSIAAGYIGVGGFNGVGETNGRGTLIQSNGSISTSPGLDMVIGWGAGSTGNYTLSGTGVVNANQSIFVGAKGNGTFTQSGGTTNIIASAVGYLNIGANLGSSGMYNLSGGTLSVAKFEYVGDQGTGAFNQTGGTNTITGAGNGLLLGNTATGVGTYTASGTAALTVPGDVTVGLNGSGTFNVQGNANVNISGALKIGAGDAVNLSGGTLRFDGYTRNATGTLNFTGGTVKLSPTITRYFNFNSTITDIFGANPLIANGRNLTLEGKSVIGANALGTVTVSNAVLTTQDDLSVGYGSDNGTLNINNGSTVNSEDVTIGDSASSSLFPLGVVNVNQAIWNSGWTKIGNGGQGTLNITNGGYVVSSSAIIGYDHNGIDVPTNTVLVSGPGSTWICSSTLNVGYFTNGKLTIENGGSVYVGTQLEISQRDSIEMNGGTLRFGTLILDAFGVDSPNAGEIHYNAGTLQFGGSRDVGADLQIKHFYGQVPEIPTGKGLVIENTMTLSAPVHLNGGLLKTFILNVTTGSLDFDGGVFELTGGPVTGLNSLTVPTGGEFRALGDYSFRVGAAADSVITATGNLGIGNPALVNGFYANGTINVGVNTITLKDANDVVLDSGALVSLGSGASPGTVSAANGLTLDFGGNITGYGTVSTPNTIAKPLINNGHITGNSAAQKITLPGYVKGVGTFDNVSFTGTFSPGLSPTILSVGSIALSDSSTLVMELGGTAAGSGYDQIQSSGTLTFDGTLQIALINGFTPTAGQSFNLFDWLTTGGTFDTLALPTLAGLAWNTSQLYTDGVLSLVTSAGLPGDYNQNGTVDAADYTEWRDHLGGGTSLPNDDTAGVGPDDYTRWKTHFGETSGGGLGADSAGAAAVPEPSASLLCVGAFLFVAFRGRLTFKSWSH